MVDVISSCGDYVYQATLTETIFRMCSAEQIKQYAAIFFPETNELKNALINMKLNNFDVHLREFLNTVNSKSKKVYSIQCADVFLGTIPITGPEESDVWVDFNLGFRSISILCDRRCLTKGTEDMNNEDGWETVTSTVDNISCVLSQRWKSPDEKIARTGSIIEFTLEAPCLCLFPSSHKAAANAKYLRLMIFDTSRLEELELYVLPKMFGNKYFPSRTSSKKVVNDDLSRQSSTTRNSYKPLKISITKKQSLTALLTTPKSSKKHSSISQNLNEAKGECYNDYISDISLDPLSLPFSRELTDDGDFDSSTTPLNNSFIRNKRSKIYKMSSRKSALSSNSLQYDPIAEAEEFESHTGAEKNNNKLSSEKINLTSNFVSNDTFNCRSDTENLKIISIAGATATGTESNDAISAKPNQDHFKSSICKNSQNIIPLESKESSTRKCSLSEKINYGNYCVTNNSIESTRNLFKSLPKFKLAGKEYETSLTSETKITDIQNMNSMNTNEPLIIKNISQENILCSNNQTKILDSENIAKENLDADSKLVVNSTKQSVGGNKDMIESLLKTRSLGPYDLRERKYETGENEKVSSEILISPLLCVDDFTQDSTRFGSYISESEKIGTYEKMHFNAHKGENLQKERKHTTREPTDDKIKKSLTKTDLLEFSENLDSDSLTEDCFQSNIEAIESVESIDQCQGKSQNLKENKNNEVLVSQKNENRQYLADTKMLNRKLSADDESQNNKGNSLNQEKAMGDTVKAIQPKFDILTRDLLQNNVSGYNSFGEQSSYYTCSERIHVSVPGAKNSTTEKLNNNSQYFTCTEDSNKLKEWQFQEGNKSFIKKSRKQRDALERVSSEKKSSHGFTSFETKENKMKCATESQSNYSENEFKNLENKNGTKDQNPKKQRNKSNKLLNANESINHKLIDENKEMKTSTKQVNYEEASTTNSENELHRLSVAVEVNKSDDKINKRRIERIKSQKFKIKNAGTFVEIEEKERVAADNMEKYGKPLLEEEEVKDTDNKIKNNLCVQNTVNEYCNNEKVNNLKRAFPSNTLNPEAIDIKQQQPMKCISDKIEKKKNGQSVLITTKEGNNTCNCTNFETDNQSTIKAKLINNLNVSPTKKLELITKTCSANLNNSEFYSDYSERGMKFASRNNATSENINNKQNLKSVTQTDISKYKGFESVIKPCWVILKRENLEEKLKRIKLDCKRKKNEQLSSNNLKCKKHKPFNTQNYLASNEVCLSKRSFPSELHSNNLVNKEQISQNLWNDYDSSINNLPTKNYTEQNKDLNDDNCKEVLVKTGGKLKDSGNDSRERKPLNNLQLTSLTKVVQNKRKENELSIELVELAAADSLKNVETNLLNRGIRNQKKVREIPIKLSNQIIPERNKNGNGSFDKLKNEGSTLFNCNKNIPINVEKTAEIITNEQSSEVPDEHVRTVPADNELVMKVLEKSDKELFKYHPEKEVILSQSRPSKKHTGSKTTEKRKEDMGKNCPKINILSNIVITKENEIKYDQSVIKRGQKRKLYNINDLSYVESSFDQEFINNDMFTNNEVENKTLNVKKCIKPDEQCEMKAGKELSFQNPSLQNNDRKYSFEAFKAKINKSRLNSLREMHKNRFAEVINEFLNEPNTPNPSFSYSSKVKTKTKQLRLTSKYKRNTTKKNNKSQKSTELDKNHNLTLEKAQKYAAKRKRGKSGQLEEYRKPVKNSTPINPLNENREESITQPKLQETDFFNDLSTDYSYIQQTEKVNGKLISEDNIRTWIATGSIADKEEIFKRMEILFKCIVKLTKESLEILKGNIPAHRKPLYDAIWLISNTLENYFEDEGTNGGHKEFSETSFM